MKRRRGMGLLEVLVAMAIFSGMAVATTMMYQNALTSIRHSSNRASAKQRVREAASRLTPMLASAYIPALPGATSPLEKPLAPYASGAPAADPLLDTGPGNDSLLFYSPADLFHPEVGLTPPGQTTVHLYEVRLLAPEPDRTGRNRTLRDLVLTEMQVPAAAGGAVAPLPNGGRRILGRQLSDFRVTRQGGDGVQLHLAAQDVNWKLSHDPTLFTTDLDTRVCFPAVAY